MWVVLSAMLLRPLSCRVMVFLPFYLDLFLRVGGPVPSRALLCLVLITSSDHRVLLTEITFLRFSPPDNIDEDNIRHQIFIAACFVSICVAKSVPGSESSSFIHRLIITISCKYLVIITILGRFVYFLQP